MQPRLRLSAPRAPFTSQPDRVARVTLAWLDAEGPVILGTGPFRTVVVVWPTDLHGYVDVEGWHHARLAAREVLTASWPIRVPEQLGLFGSWLAGRVA